MKPLKFLLVDDHPLFRKAVRDMLEEAPFVGDVHELGDGRECVESIHQNAIDVVLLDVNMPEMDGITTMKALKEMDKMPTVIILTQFADSKFYTTLMALGAQGYLMKSTTEEEFLDALEDILFENKRIVNRPTPRRKRNDVLGNREKQILSLICQQMSSEEIAEHLHISIHTVSNHRKNIMRKIDVNSVAGMVKWATDHRLA
jgi:DNA-binding NarL/FixJ family response regulator